MADRVFSAKIPTGNSFDILSLNALRMENGKTAEVWIEWDALGMYDQLGLVTIAVD